jgi:hypothetical protein
MTPAEFKAWFDGFTEGMDGPPSIKQWKKITDKVKSIDGTSVLTPIYVDRWWPSVPTWGGAGTGDAPSWIKSPIICSSGSTTVRADSVSSFTVRLNAADLHGINVTPTASALLMAEGRADALAAA